MHSPSPVDHRELRQFGFLFAGILIALFELLLPWLRGRPWPLWPLYIGVPVATLALVWPAALRPLYVVWMKFGAVMGWINTRVIMCVFFFAILTPIGWLLRWRGRDPLVRTFDRSAGSYRVASETPSKDQLEKPY
jgi:Saxitoxin biosynthesis operon protein SxtJ